MGESLPLDLQKLYNEADSLPGIGLPQQTVIGHIHLHVDDLKTAEEFYNKILGFGVMIRMQGHALFVSAGRYHHHIGLNTWAGVGAPPNPSNAVGLHVFSIEVLTEEEVDSIRERLKSRGIAVHEQNEGILVQDPAGNQILIRS